MKRNATEV